MSGEWLTAVASATASLVLWLLCFGFKVPT